MQTKNVQRLKALIREEIRRQTGLLREEKWTAEAGSGGREGNLGIVKLDGKPVIAYEFDYDMGGYWIDGADKPLRGTNQEMVDYVKAKYAAGRIEGEGKDARIVKR